MQENTKDGTHRDGSCVVCNEPISKSAEKCIHCSSFQDWRRYLAVSTSLLALIVATSSAFAGLVALSKTFPDFRPSKEEVYLGWSGTTPGGTVIWAVNDGTGTGILGMGIKFHVESDSGEETLAAEFIPVEGNSSLVLEAGAKQVYHIGFVTENPWSILGEEGGKFWAVIKIFNSKGKERELVLHKVDVPNRSNE